MIIRPATINDILEYAGDLPPCQIRAVAAEIDGVVVGIGGLAFLPNGSALAFMNADDVVRERGRVALYRAAKRFIAQAADRGLRKISAVKADDIEAAERFLIRLGFQPIGDNIFQYEG